MNDITKRAKAAFDRYAGMDGPDLPSTPINIAALQVRLTRWQTRNFGGCNVSELALGVAEESGELCHAVLKHQQKIRGMADQGAFLDAAGDAIADATVYLMQMATLLRMDFGELLLATAEQVMSRDWKANPDMKALALHCDDCNDVIDEQGRYYQDVPDIGDLCLDCHKNRFGATS